VTLWVLLALAVILLICVAGLYLWFRAQVGASNARVDPAIIEALGEPASGATAATTAGGQSDGSATSSTTEAPPERPTGMNVVLLGSDTRSTNGKGGRSDTIILVHIDPDNDYLSMLSIPRDLKVAIPGHGTNKINAAYAYGGAALLIRTVQSALGVDLDHFVKVDFSAFKEITDTLGGVYVDVDRTYDDGKIQLKPGYQLLDGQNALRYCRTRHDSNYDFGRMERQQRFLSAVREQAMGWNLAFKLPSLIKATFGNVDTDLGANDILKLAHWGVRLDGGRTKLATIVAPTGTIDGVSYVLASSTQISSAVKSFLTPPPVASAQVGATSQQEPAVVNAALSPVSLDGIAVDVVNGTGRRGQGAFAALWLSGRGAAVGGVWTDAASTPAKTEVTYPAAQSEAARLVAQSLGITASRQTSAVNKVTVTLGSLYSLAPSQVSSARTGSLPNGEAWQTLAGQAGFPLVAPRFLPAKCKYSYKRSYSIRVGDQTRPAVRVGYRFAGKDQYLGVSETTWLDAPIASPGKEVQGDGVVFTVVGTSTKTDHVWWIEDDVLHWVSNTLRFELSGEQLLAVAVSTAAVSAAVPD
jgi:LCP family protein required for cell wall assembly